MYVEAESAVREKIERRVQMQALLTDVRAGDVVLTHRVDRWSRDPEFTYRTVREILAKGIAMYFIDDRIDPSTSEGDTALGFRVLYSREEHKRIKQRMVGTRQLLKDKGFYADGLVPLGYRRTGGKGIEKNILVEDDVNAERVRRAFRMASQGRSLAEISEAIDLEKSLTHRLLRSRTYLGEVRDSRGHWILGRHKALVEARLFALANDTMQGRRYGWSKPVDATAETAVWWLRDIARCGQCGAKMTSAYRRLASGETTYYLFCRTRCGTPYLRVDAAEAACDPLVLERLRSLATELTGPTKTAKALPIVDVAAKRAGLEKKRERYLEAFADGHLDREQLRTKMTGLDAERTKLDALSAPTVPASPAARKAVLATVNEIAKAWSQTSATQRRALVRDLAKTVGLVKDATPVFEWRTAAELSEGTDK